MIMKIEIEDLKFASLKMSKLKKFKRKINLWIRYKLIFSSHSRSYKWKYTLSQ